MNKRIRKKKAKQQLIRAISGLVEAAEEMLGNRNAGQDRQVFPISSISKLSGNGSTALSLSTHRFLKRRELKVKIINTGYMVRAPTPCAYRGRKPHPTTEYRRAAATNAARGLMTAAVIEN